MKRLHFQNVESGICGEKIDKEEEKEVKKK